MASERQLSTLPPAQPSYILRGHASQVHSVQFVRQNTRLLTGDADGWVIFWKLETKRALAVWKAHDGAILGIAEWAHNKIVTHGRDNTLRIWQIRAADESVLSTALPADLVSGDRPVPWLLHTLPVNTLNFCAFSMCHATETHTYGAVDYKERPRPEEARASILIAVPARDDKKAEVYRFPEERLRYVVPRVQSKDTGMIMAIKLVQAPASQKKLVVTGYEGGLTAVHVLPEEEDSTVGVAQLLYLSQPHTQPILSLDVLPDAEMYFTSSADAIVAAHHIPNLSYKLEKESPLICTEGDEDDPPVSIPLVGFRDISQMAASATVTGTTDTSADDPPISVPDNSLDEISSFPKRSVTALAQPEQSSRKPGGLSSLLCKESASSKLAKAAQPPPLSAPSLQAPYKVINTKHAGQQSLSIRSDGRIMATGGWDSRVRIYSTKTLKEVAVLRWHKEGVYAVAFADILGASSSQCYSDENESELAEGEVAKKETGLSKLQREREERMQVKHWIAAGAKDGKVSLWEVF